MKISPMYYMSIAFFWELRVFVTRSTCSILGNSLEDLLPQYEIIQSDPFFVRNVLSECCLKMGIGESSNEYHIGKRSL